MAVAATTEFQPENESIEAYLERIEIYFDVNGVADDKKVSVFLNALGGKTYTLLRNLLAPAKLNTKSLNDLTTALNNHYAPKRVVIAERFHFYRRNQAPGESIAEFVAELRKLSTHCSFKDSQLEEALRDRLVCGLRSVATQRRLLTEAKLTFADALKTAQGMEAAERNAQTLKESSDAAVHYVRKAPSGNAKPSMKQVSKTKTCYRCGRADHQHSSCPFKDSKCHYCKKTGHIASVCRKKKAEQGQEQHGKQQHRTKYVAAEPQELSSDSDTDSIPIKQLRGGSKSRSSHPITVQVQVNGKPIQMELDTGAAVSVISEQLHKKLFPDAKLRPAHALLRTYTGEPMAVTGEMIAQVQYQSQSCSLPLLVVGGEGPPLFGRDWLKHVKLDWQTIGLTALSGGVARVQDLLHKYPAVFSEKLGQMKHHQATLHVPASATPVFCKARPVPFALKEAASKELDRLEQAGIVEKVERSDWAAPVVLVPKRDGSIRLCGDYKLTVNRHLDVDQYPLPIANDLFVSLTGGKKFTKLDLAQAYQQMALEEQSQTYCTINTHQGLYRFNRLPFGVASAPAIFQRTMDTILQGIPHVLCYIDDLLITGETEEEHLRNLEEVLKRLQDHGIVLKKSKCFFLQDSVEYLGHIIDAEGLHTSPKKVEAVLQAPKPTNQHQLRSFLGLLQYYGKFLHNLSTLLSPLNALLQDTPWKWTKECDQAFIDAKSALASAAVLVHYNPKLPLRLATDASAYGIGAVISHMSAEGEERPIAYASRTLTAAEKS